MKRFAAALVCSLAGALLAAEYPPPLDFGPSHAYGRHLQRSLRLMAESPPARKRTVKVLFYGQSVTQEIWSVWLANHLRERFPNARLVVTNLAVGYESSLLVKTAAVDIPGFYPDLMIFQDYGEGRFIDQMIELTRRQTTADILIQTDHIHRSEDLLEPTDPRQPLPERAWRNYWELPQIAKRYGAELADIRTGWKAYLRHYELKTEDLLRDHIHPNRHGSFLMTELLKPHLREDRAFPAEEWIEAEKTYEIGRDVHWSGGLLQLDFHGNRVDVIAEGSSFSPLEVWIDGRRPSELPELYHFTRASWYPGTFWLNILKIAPRTPLIEEDWMARVLSFSTNGGVPRMEFEVLGSKTGFDGTGSIAEPFVSHSGRVRIDPADWLMIHWVAAYYPRLAPLAPGHEIRWRSHFAGRDEFTPRVEDPGLETAITVAQGLGSGPHTLVLRRLGSDPAPLSAVRIYNPQARKQPPRTRPPEIAEITRRGSNIALRISESGRYVVEASSDGGNWRPVSAPLEDLEILVPMEQRWQFIRLRALD